MWQASKSSGSSTLGRRRHNRNRRRIRLHIRRVRGEIHIVASNPPVPVIQIRVLLHDISHTGVGLFANQKLLAGQEIDIVLEVQDGFRIRGKVVWCREHNMASHILSQHPFLHRAGIQFQFQSPEEESRLRQLCERLASVPAN